MKPACPENIQSILAAVKDPAVWMTSQDRVLSIRDRLACSTTTSLVVWLVDL
jgi:hypothetical protein